MPWRRWRASAPQWGILTGVRPTKLVHQMLDGASRTPWPA